MRRGTTAALSAVVLATAVISGCGDDGGSATTPSGAAVTTVAGGGGGASTTVGGATGELADVVDGADLSTLRQALTLTGLLDDVDKGPATLFAPVDDAFLKLPASKIADLLANPDELRGVLEHHLVRQALPADQLAKQTTVKTEAGDDLTVTSSGGTVTVGGARVLRSGTSKDGMLIVHVVDKVLGVDS